jgi:hypothetical protein
MWIIELHDMGPVLKSFFKEVARGGEQTWVLSISFIFSFFQHFTAKPQRLPWF